MKKYKKKMWLATLALLVIGITIGYAILTSNLNLGGVTTIASNAWDVHFENLEKTTGSVTATKEATIDAEKTSVDFEVTFEKPGDFYEFKVDIVNAGKIDAKLDDIIKTGLTAEQQELLNFTARYESGRALEKGNLLSANSSQKIIVRAEYKTSATNPVTEDMVLNLNIDLKYVQDDGTAEEIPTAGSLYQMIANNAVRDDIKSDYVTGEYGIDFSKISSDTNGKGIYTLTSESNGVYPVHYYRGDVANNNVIFGRFCWKMLRTTDTGGIKLVYNGTPTNGTCNGITSATRIDSPSITPTSPEIVGYMHASASHTGSSTLNRTWHEVLPLTDKSFRSLAGTNYIFGKNVTYSNGVYTITDGVTHSWDSDYKKLTDYVSCFSESNTCTEVYYIYYTDQDSASTDTIKDGKTIESLKFDASQKHYVLGDSYTYSNGNYILNNPTNIYITNADMSLVPQKRYTCLSESNSCNSLAYIYKIKSNTIYYTLLGGGETLDDRLNDLTNSPNTVNSAFKSQVDNWYKSNLLSYESYLEDTIFCNDRTVTNFAGWKSTGSYSEDLTYAPYNRLKNGTPSLACPLNDSFSKTNIGNGKLTYPVGLMTIDELMYAGYNSSNSTKTYLTTMPPANDTSFAYKYEAFTMSPRMFRDNTADSYTLRVGNSSANYCNGACPYSFRPVVSLKGSTEYASGDGTVTSPYTIEGE